MASEQTVLNCMGKALFDPHPTGTDLRARQLAAALGYPVDWRVVRTLEKVPVVHKNSKQRQSSKCDAISTNPAEETTPGEPIVPIAVQDTTELKTEEDEEAAPVAKEELVLCIVDRIYSSKPGTGCDMWYHHAAAMQVAENWVEGESTPFDHAGGHMLPRQPLFEKGDKVQVSYDKDWWDAKILKRTKKKNGCFSYSVSYAADSTRQSGVDEELIRPRPSTVDPSKFAEELGFGEGWQAFSTGNNRWKIVGPTGKTYTSKKLALAAFKDGSEMQAEDGDPPWRRNGGQYLGKEVLFSADHKVSSRRTVTVEQIGKVTGWISATDVDAAGEPGFISEHTGQPAALYHVEFQEDKTHPYPKLLVESQDMEEFELIKCLLPEENKEAGPPPKKTKR